MRGLLCTGPVEAGAHRRQAASRGALVALDHVLLAVRDLDRAAEIQSALLGRAPSWRGAHPGAGTANALYRLENTYVELLAPSGAGAVGDWLRAQLEARGEGPLGLAFATDDADACRDAFAERGLHPAHPATGSGRERDTGAERRWRQVLLPADETRGVLLFAIQHDSPPEALPFAPAACAPGAAVSAVSAVDHVVVRTRDVAAARALYGERLGLRLALERRFEEWGVHLLFFRVGGATVELAAPLAPDAADQEGARDRLWGVSYRVPELAAARARVADAGFDVSELRAGRRPGTRVCTVRGEPCGAATLLIGPDPAHP